MKSKRCAEIKDGKIITLWDSSHEEELTGNQVPLTSNEYWLLKAVRGDLELAKNIIRDIEERIKRLGTS